MTVAGVDQVLYILKGFNLEPCLNLKELSDGNILDFCLISMKNFAFQYEGIL